MSALFSYASVCGAAAVAFFTAALGGFDNMAEVLIYFMIADYITGLIVAGYKHRFSSKIGFKGILKKVAIIACVFVAVKLELLFPDLPIRTVVISFYVANEGLSILENLAAVIPIPDNLKDYFLQIRSDEKEKEKHE